MFGRRKSFALLLIIRPQNRPKRPVEIALYPSLRPFDAQGGPYIYQGHLYLQK